MSIKDFHLNSKSQILIMSNNSKTSSNIKRQNIYFLIHLGDTNHDKAGFHPTWYAVIEL